MIVVHATSLDVDYSEGDDCSSLHQQSIYCYLLHNSTGLLLSAHILLLSTSPTTNPAIFPTVVIPQISRRSSVKYTLAEINLQS